MNCTRYRQLISRYVDDEVTPRQRRELLAHVEHCHECAAWLARARQTDVLLKSVGDTGPSDNIRKAILSQIHASNHAESTLHPRRTPHPLRGYLALRTWLASLLLRFDPSPRRIVISMAALFLTTLGMLYWLNVLPPIWGYDKLGFEVQPDQSGAMDATPIPIRAVSAGKFGTGGALSSPNLVLAQPDSGSQVFALTQPVIMRFDQPMDRASVEQALSITPPTAGQLTWDADNELEWKPSAPGLLRGVTYTITLTNSALSQTGAPIAKPSIWSFRTADAHHVTPYTPDRAVVTPLSSFTLNFDSPMESNSAQAAVSLRSLLSGVSANVPTSLAWTADGKRLTITPLRPLPAGQVSLVVEAQAATKSGDTLGRSYEFLYRVDLPSPRVQLLDGRVTVAHADAPVAVRYSASGLDSLVFDVYSFPAEKLSALGAQASAWPMSLPAGFPAGLQLTATGDSNVAATGGIAHLPVLAAGIYLLVVHDAASSLTPNPERTDWQLLVVGDGNLISTGPGLPLWAVNEAGHAWEGAEVSLYSPDGALLDKGLTNLAGLYLPGQAQGASLAIARDPFGHVASLILDSTVLSTAVHNDESLPSTLLTDRQAYRPGDTISFRADLFSPAQTAITPNQARLAEPTESNTVFVQLFAPQGELVSALVLKPDGEGGASGTFPLATNASPGTYTIHVRQGDIAHDFPITVLSSRSDSLSVSILPNNEVQADSASITYTVSVLGAGGKPAVGALITGTLGIKGDEWASAPVWAVADSNGLAVLSLPLPTWFAHFNDPGLYLRVEASTGSGELVAKGEDTLSLDFTSQHSAASGQTQIVSPLLNVAVIARPAPLEGQSQPGTSDPGFRIRAVLLDPSPASGDILLLAQSPSGERLSYAIDLASKPAGDATLSVPRRFAGGTLSIFSASVSWGRVLNLLQAGDAPADLRVLAPVSATVSSPIPIRLILSDPDGGGLAGSASLVWRRVSDAPSDRPVDWQPSIALTSTGAVTATLQTPSAPGLWYLASTAVVEGGVAHGFAVVRVLPSGWLQLPPAVSSQAGDLASFSVRVHNPGSEPLNTSLRAWEDGDLHVEGNSARDLSVPANGWADVPWQASQMAAGDSRILFSLTSSAASPPGMANPLDSLPLSVTYSPNPQINVTYTAGALTGERSVGVAVPWGLDSSHVTLEIRASTSLLPALGSIARDLQSERASPSDGVSMSAARLSVGAPVASAYANANATSPYDFSLSTIQRSLLLQQLYSAQHSDGGWGDSLAGYRPSSLSQTAAVLLSFSRASHYPYTVGAQVQPDQAVIDHAVAYLSSELTRPLPTIPSSANLDERAFVLYVLSLYRPVPDDWLRPMLAYALPDPSTQAESLSTDGQGWLALALNQSNDVADAQALLDAATRGLTNGAVQPSAPMLLAIMSVPSSKFQVPVGTNTNPGTQNSELGTRIVQSLMASRAGSGWHTPLATADAISALALYSIVQGEHPRTESPAILLGDSPIQSTGPSNDPADISIVLSGADLRPGTNWLKLRSPVSGAPLYYSLTLIATR